MYAVYTMEQDKVQCGHFTQTETQNIIERLGDCPKVRVDPYTVIFPGGDYLIIIKKA